MSRYLLNYFYPVAAQISLEWRMYYTPVWNVMLSILRSQMDFYIMEMILVYQNWQDNISNGCVHPLFKWDLCSDRVKIDWQVVQLCFWELFFKKKYFKKHWLNDVKIVFITHNISIFKIPLWIYPVSWPEASHVYLIMASN